MKFNCFSTRLLVAGFSVLMLGSCAEGGKDPLVVGNQYDATNFIANTATENAVLGQLDALAAEMRKGRTAGVSLDAATLRGLYTAGNPGLDDVTTAFYNDVLNGPGGVFDAMAEAAGNTWTPGQTTGPGGVYGDYLFDEHGVDLEQVAHKGLFGAALYNHAQTLMNSSAPGLEEVDRILRIYGAKPAFKNSDNSTLHGTDADKYLALYAARRDKNDGTGVYTAIRDQFLKLQAAAKAGSDYDAERNQALADIRLLWEKANAATVINYLHASISTLSATNPTDKEVSIALHSLSENVGFLMGWRTLPQGMRRITDAQIDEYLALLNYPVGGTPTLYKFATEPVTELAKLEELKSKLQALYGFTNQEVEEFKKNWVAEQGR